VVLAAGWAALVEPRRLVVRRHTIATPGWPDRYWGLRTAILADLHAGSAHVDRARIERVVEAVNAEEVDLLLVPGDVMESGFSLASSRVTVDGVAERLARLRAPLGVYAVLGNHDWWFDGARMTRAFESAGLSVLENRAVRVERGGRGLWLAGVADLWTRKPDVEGTLRQVDTDEPVILFTHNPDIFPDVPTRVSLTLGGHTHGGQVNLPLIGRPVVPSHYGQRYAFGHVVEGGRHLYVGGGVGTSIIPARFRVPPEILVLTLEPEG